MSRVLLTIEQTMALGRGRSTVHRRIADGDWESQGEGRQRRVALDCLPRDMQDEYWRQVNAGQQRPIYNGIELDDLPVGRDRRLLAELALERARVLTNWAQLSPDRRPHAVPRIAQEWVDAVPAELREERELMRKPHKATLYRAWERLQKRGPIATLGRFLRREIHRDTRLPDEALAYIHDLWLNQHALHHSRVHRAYTKEARRRGWPEISYHTVRRHILAIPRDVEFLARNGERAFESQAAPYIVRDVTELVPGSHLVGDHHQFDFFVRDEISGALLKRPWLTANACMRTTGLQGWCMSFKPNGKTIIRALIHAIRPKARPEYAAWCGVPSDYLIDNGKDYRSDALNGRTERFRVGMYERDARLLQGLLPSLNIHTSFARPYNAKAKVIERVFGVVASDFSPCVPGYCGRDAKNKPAELAKQVRQHEAWLAGKRRETPFLTLPEIERMFEAWVFEYHGRERKGLTNDGRKLSPLQVYELHAQAPVLPTARSLEFLLMDVDRRTVQKNGLRIGPIWYRSEELLGHRKELVEVRRDPADTGRVYVFDLNGNFICEAANVAALRVGASADQVAEANKAIREHIKRKKKAIRTLTEPAPVDAMTLMESLTADIPPAPDAEPAEPADVVRRMTPKYDGVPLRQTEAPPAPPRKVVRLLEAPPPPLQPKPRLFLFDADKEADELEAQFAAQAGGGRGDR